MAVPVVKPIYRAFADSRHLPKCGETRSTVYFNDTPTSDRGCSVVATLVVDGKKMCKRHAAYYVLNKLLEVHL